MEETNVELLRCNFIKEDEKGNIIKSNNDLLDLSNKILDKSEINNKLLLNIFEDKLPTYVYLLFAKTETIKNKLEFRTDIRMMEDLIFCLELYMNIKQISKSRCHITITTEIKINLKCISKHCDNCFC